MSDATTPAEAEYTDFRERVCRDCAFFVLRADLAGGDCRESRPSAVHEDPARHPYAQSWEFLYPSLRPGTPACASYMSPEEWAAYRSRLARLLAEPESVEVVSAASRP